MLGIFLSRIGPGLSCWSLDVADAARVEKDLPAAATAAVQGWIPNAGWTNPLVEGREQQKISPCNRKTGFSHRGRTSFQLFLHWQIQGGQISGRKSCQVVPEKRPNFQKSSLLNTSVN